MSTRPTEDDERSVREWAPQFVRAATYEDRAPAWHVLKFEARLEVALRRVLDVTHLEHDYLRLRRQVARRPAHWVAWLPGYLFVKFDATRDFWQQLLRAPGVLEVLGAPTAIRQDELDEVKKFCPERHGKPGPRETIPLGTLVEILSGVLQGQRARVTMSDHKLLKVAHVMFGRPLEIDLKTADVRVISDG